MARASKVTKPKGSRPSKKKPSKPAQAVAESSVAAVEDDGRSVFFWRESDPLNGYLSQWYSCSFTDEDGVEYKTAEHYMMYQKAVLFNDPEAGAKILKADHPRKVKSLGRTVKNFDDKVWNEKRYDIVVRGNVYKFTRAVTEEGLRFGSGEKGELLGSMSLRETLLNTGDRELVEASPVDRIWGVGFAPNRAAGERARWGLNLLGKALMEVRNGFKSKDEGKGKRKEEAS